MSFIPLSGTENCLISCLIAGKKVLSSSMIPVEQAVPQSFVQLVRSCAMNKAIRKSLVFENYGPSPKVGKTFSLRWKDLDFYATQLGELLSQAIGVCDIGFVGLMVHPENICACAVAVLACLQAKVTLVPIREGKNIPMNEPFEYELYNIAKVIKLRMILVDKWYRKKIQKSKLINEKNDDMPEMVAVFGTLDMLEIFKGYPKFKFDKKLLQEPVREERNSDNACLSFVNTVGVVTIGAIQEQLLLQQAKFLTGIFEFQKNESVLSTFDCCSPQGIMMNILLPIAGNLRCTIACSCKGKEFMQLYNKVKPTQLMIREGEVEEIGRIWNEHFRLFRWKRMEGLIFQKENYCWNSQEQLTSNLEGYFGHSLRTRFFFGTGTETDDVRGNLIAAGSGLNGSTVPIGRETLEKEKNKIFLNGPAEFFNEINLIQSNNFSNYQTFPEEQDHFVTENYLEPTKILNTSIEGLLFGYWDSNRGMKFKDKAGLTSFLRNQRTGEFLNSKFYATQQRHDGKMLILSSVEKTLSISNNDAVAVKIPHQVLVNMVLQNYNNVQKWARTVDFLGIVCEVESAVTASIFKHIANTVKNNFHIEPAFCLAMRQELVPLLKNGQLDAEQFKCSFFKGKMPIDAFWFNKHHKLLRRETLSLQQEAENFSLPQVTVAEEEKILNSFVSRDYTQPKSHISIISLLPETLQIEPNAAFAQWVTVSRGIVDKMLLRKEAYQYKPAVTLTKIKLEQKINKTIHLLEKLEISSQKSDQVLIIGEKNCNFYSTLYGCMCVGLNVGIMPVYCWNYFKFASILSQIHVQFKFTKIIVTNREAKEFLSSHQLQVQLGKFSGDLVRCSEGALVIDDEVLKKIPNSKCKNYLCPEKSKPKRGSTVKADGNAEATFHQIHVSESMSVAVVTCTQAELYDYCGILLKNYPELGAQKCIIASPHIVPSSGFQGTMMLMDIFMGIFQGLPVMHKSEEEGEHSSDDSHDIRCCRLLLNHLRLVDYFQSKVLFLPTEFLHQTIPFIKPDYRGFCLKSLSRFILLGNTQSLHSLNERIAETFLCNNLQPSCIQECFECPFYPGGMATIVSQMSAPKLLLNSDHLSYRVLTPIDKYACKERETACRNELKCMGKLVEGLSVEIIPTEWEPSSSVHAKPTVGRIVLHSHSATYKTDSVGFMLTRSQWNYPYIYLLGTMHDFVKYGRREWCAVEVENFLQEAFPCAIPGRVHFVAAKGRSSSGGSKDVRLVVGVEVLSKEEADAVAPALLFKFWERYNECLDRLVVMKYNPPQDCLQNSAENLVRDSLRASQGKKHLGSQIRLPSLPAGLTRAEFGRNLENNVLAEVLLDIEFNRQLK